MPVTITAKLLDHPDLGAAEDQDLHLEALAARWSVSKSEVIRALVQTGLGNNAIDDGERARARAARTQGRKRLTVGPDGQLKALAGAPLVAHERPDIAATRELAARTYGRLAGAGGASVAADRRRRGPAHEQGERAAEGRTERGGFEPRVISAHTQRRSRPDVRPAGQRRRHLRAV